VDALRVNRRRGTQRTIARKVQFSVVGGGEEPPPAEPGVGQPARRGTAAARASTRAEGATLRANDSPPGARGDPMHRPGCAVPTPVGTVARSAACPSSAIPRRPREKGRTLEREGARASATRSNGGWTLRRGRPRHRWGELLLGNQEARAFAETWTRSDRGRKRRTSSRGGVARGGWFQHAAHRDPPGSGNPRTSAGNGQGGRAW